MAFMELKFFSEVLKIQTEVYVIIPQKKSSGESSEIGNSKGENLGDGGKYKCLYLLHGLSDDHTIWMRRTSIERYADKYGICVVMPCGGRSFYTDMKYGPKYYTFIAKELPEKIREFLNVSDKREDNFVAGLSMGGYGALKIALRESDRFVAAAALSPAIDIERRKQNETFLPIFGEAGVVPDEDDLFKLAKKCKDREDKPRVFLAIGLEDSLYAETQRMREELEGDGYDIIYRESHGTHSWDLWDEYIQYALEWMLK